MALHDSLLATQRYRQVYSLAESVAARAQQTWAFQAARDRLLPLLPEPAVNTATPYLTSLAAHLQPIKAA